MLAEWPRAWAGVYVAQRNVSYLLSQPKAGVPQNPIQGCAWRMVILASGHPEVGESDTMSYDASCRKLSELEFQSAKASAENVFKTIKGGKMPDFKAPAPR
jgi:hypothetical protein